MTLVLPSESGFADGCPHGIGTPSNAVRHVNAPRPRLRACAEPGPLAGLLAADCPESRHRIVESLLLASEHEWLAYGAIEPVVERLRPVSIWMAHANIDWVRHYDAQGYYEVDPRLEAAAATSLPSAWTLESLRELARDASPRSKLRQFVSDLGDAGIHSGVLLMLPGEGEQRRHFMSLQASARRGRPMDGVLLGQVLTLGLCLNEYFTRHSKLPEVASRSVDPLSSVQREILGHVARGESDKRIAHLLCMSSHTVDYHLRRLRQRFAVRNRVQLAQACGAVLR